MSNTKQQQYEKYLTGGGRLTMREWEAAGKFDAKGNRLTCHDLQIGNYVALVYENRKYRRVQAIYDNSVFLEGRADADDERDLMPISISKSVLKKLRLEKQWNILKTSGIVLNLPYVHMLQQFCNLLRQSEDFLNGSI